jgi:hypothetical protein
MDSKQVSGLGVIQLLAGDCLLELDCYFFPQVIV